jgi:predicted O-methyltransferase YrrM
MRPSGLVAVCNDIVHGARTSVVECGSGVSTVVLARLLRERGAGTLTALEHDAHWAEMVRDLLRREDLDGVARVVDAPLEGDPPWYAEAALRELPAVVDLLVVDGPPANAAGQGTRRAPALPRLAHRLADGATVVLDDIARAGEREVLDGWEARSGWRFKRDERAGIAVGRR